MSAGAGAGREARRGRGPVAEPRSGKALTRRVRLRQRELKKPAILRVSGSFGFQLPLGSFGFRDAPGATAPRLDARWEFYPISADVTTAI
jgi:hypothetical protein